MILLFNSFDSAPGHLKGGDFNNKTRSGFMNPRCPKTSPSPPAPGVFISLITTSKFEKCSQFCSYNSYFLSNKMLISLWHISPSSHREFFIANINICFLAPIRNKPVKIIHNYLCSRTTKVSPPSTGGD
jgi:hypothetical protein